ncbi:MAG: hypothetical protein IT385_04280 [Deltaproteobacteria bacterium]|nr:hypothetical protein [Deltaproteobacteria bacterium]
MPRRFLVIAIVFIVGFGVGWGATWLIVGGAPDKAPQPVMTPTAQPTRVAVADVEGGTTAAPAGADAVTGAAEDVAEAPPDAGPAETAVAGDDAAPSADDAVVATAPPPESPESEVAQWWNACQGKTCVVDWGRVSGGISVRAGELEHGADVDWAATFAKADKVGTIEAKKNMKVEVLAVGMSDGKPAAAWIKYRKIKGVIALNFGDKSIRFEPPP